MFYRSGWLRCVGFKCIGLCFERLAFDLVFVFRAGVCVILLLLYYIIYYIHILLYYYIIYYILYIILYSSSSSYSSLPHFPLFLFQSPSSLLSFSSSSSSILFLLSYYSIFPSSFSSIPSSSLPFILYVSALGYPYLYSIPIFF